MTMVTQTRDSQRFAEKVRQIRTRVPTVLAQWGLRPKFARWRLTQDPSTGLVVLFGVLNNNCITAHTPTPFNDYFDPRLLFDLAIDLNVQVVSSVSEGFRYAFILDRGQLGQLPARVDFPGLEQSQLLVGITYAKQPIAVVWGRPIVVVDMTELDQPNLERHEGYQVEADFQLAIIDAQATASPLFKQLPALITPNHSPASVVAAPTVLAQVEAEVERRKALYKQLPGNPKSLNESNADNLVRSRSELMLRIRLMLDEYNDLVRPLGESEREIDEVTHIARVGRK
jgi:hypothetical protein